MKPLKYFHSIEAMEYDDLTAFANMIYPQNLGEDEQQMEFVFWFEELFFRLVESFNN